MKLRKKVIAELEKCYSVAPLAYNGEKYILVAAEKQDPCYLFDYDGNKVDTIWEQPGGVMSMVQVPNTNGCFLATHEFYSPNDSKNAKIVYVEPKEDGWAVKTLVPLPHVHRFDIIERNGVNYLIACTLKSGHEYKDDWTMPGKVYAAVLPEDLSGIDEEHPLQLEVIQENMLKNHGYYKITKDGLSHALISCESGVYDFLPPGDVKDGWTVSKLVEDPSSDAVLLDLDRDGEEELVTISPFHGENIYVYKKIDGKFKKVFSYDYAEFAHAIYGGNIQGKETVIIGHRKGTRDLQSITYDQEKRQFQVEVLDHDCGPANVYKFDDGEREFMVSTNREINQIAMYTFM